MKREQTILLLLLLLAALASCSPGHLGSNEIAFIRDGHLWTIDPDGSNAFEVVAGGAPIVGYGWSPNHQILVYRSLDDNFAKSPAAKHLGINPITGLLGDLPATLNTIGIDGGSPLPLTLPDSELQRSNAWWNTTGNRLLYREEFPKSDPTAASWWVSQNDQPVGIARKPLPATFSIPSTSAYSDLAIGNSQQGVFTTTLAGTGLQYLLHGVLPGHPLPASLERVLWQPAHEHPAILYAITTSQSFTSTSTSIQLVFRAANGDTSTLATCACTQFAWSPDGNFVLYTTGSTFTVYNLKNRSSFTISAETESVPYWSPDSQFLLLDGLHTLLVVQIASKQEQTLLSDASPPASYSKLTTNTAINALLQPLSNSPWAADSRHFLFLTRDRLFWQGQRLSSGKGLYTVSIDSHAKPQGTPGLVDTGNDIQPAWSYEDANTSFLL